MKNVRLKAACIGWIILSVTSGCGENYITKEAQQFAATDIQKGQTIVGKAVSITDGDTFTMLLSENKSVKIRLYGIDCPERGQPFYRVAKDFLGKRIESREVSVYVQNKDQYGRIVGIVKENTTAINELMLKEGMAWHYKHYDRNPTWAAMEKEASSQKKGLWSDKHPVAPWIWKRDKRMENK